MNSENWKFIPTSLALRQLLQSTQVKFMQQTNRRKKSDQGININGGHAPVEYNANGHPQTSYQNSNYRIASSTWNWSDQVKLYSSDSSKRSRRKHPTWCGSEIEYGRGLNSAYHVWIWEPTRLATWRSLISFRKWRLYPRSKPCVYFFYSQTVKTLRKSENCLSYPIFAFPNSNLCRQDFEWIFIIWLLATIPSSRQKYGENRKSQWHDIRS